MTIKRIQRFNIPLIGQYERTTVLKPGYTQRFRFSVPDEDTRGRYEGEKTVKILSPDAIAVEVLKEDHYIGSYRDEHITPAPGSSLLEKESVRYLVDKAWGGKAWGRFGEEVDFSWEPTLPSQARK